MIEVDHFGVPSLPELLNNKNEEGTLEDSGQEGSKNRCSRRQRHQRLITNQMMLKIFHARALNLGVEQYFHF